MIGSVFFAPKGTHLLENKLKGSASLGSHSSLFRALLLNLVCTPRCRYFENKFMQSIPTRVPAMQPSGKRLLRMYDLNVPISFLVEYIHWFCTGPPNLTSFTKRIGKWIMISKNEGGKVRSNWFNVSMISTYKQSSSSNVISFWLKRWKKEFRRIKGIARWSGRMLLIGIGSK